MSNSDIVEFTLNISGAGEFDLHLDRDVPLMLNVDQQLKHVLEINRTIIFEPEI